MIKAPLDGARTWPRGRAVRVTVAPRFSAARRDIATLPFLLAGTRLT